MKILLFDDHPVVLEGLRSFFSQKENVNVVSVASKKEDARALLECQNFDILITDLITDVELSLEFFEEIQAKYIDTKVIVYSSLQGELIHNFLYEYGVVAIVNKSKGLNELWQLVEVTYLTTQHKKKQRCTSINTFA